MVMLVVLAPLLEGVVARTWIWAWGWRMAEVGLFLGRALGGNTGGLGAGGAFGRIRSIGVAVLVEGIPARMVWVWWTDVAEIVFFGEGAVEGLAFFGGASDAGRLVAGNRFALVVEPMVARVVRVWWAWWARALPLTVMADLRESATRGVQHRGGGVRLRRCTRHGLVWWFVYSCVCVGGGGG